MKYRSDFVTNSSSSSFIIEKKYLDEQQIEAIKDHHLLAPKMKMDMTKYDDWQIDENDRFITGYTRMDNFSMDDYLEKLDIPASIIKWGEYPIDLSEYESHENDDADAEEDDDINWRELI